MRKDDIDDAKASSQSNRPFHGDHSDSMFYMLVFDNTHWGFRIEDADSEATVYDSGYVYDSEEEAESAVQDYCMGLASVVRPL